MRLTLVVKDGETDFSLCCKQNDVVIASMTGPKDEFAGSISLFLKRFCIPPRQVNKVILVSDLSSLEPSSRAEQDLVYIRVIPMDTHTLDFTVNTIQDSYRFHKYDIFVDRDGKLHGLTPLFRHLDGCRVKKIAINSFFSFTNFQNEEIIASEIREKFGERHIIRTGRQLYINNMMLRENTLLLNLMLYEEAKEYLNKISEQLKKSGIAAPIFVLKCDGTLYSLRLAIDCPMETWQVGITAFMMDAAYKTRLEDIFVLFEEKGKGWLGIIRNGKPLISHKPVQYKNCYIPGNNPLLTPLPEPCTEAGLLELLKRMNPLPGPIPVVSYCSDIPKLPAFSEYPPLRVKRQPVIPGSGADAAVYRREISRLVIERSNQDILKVEQELMDSAIEELNTDCIKMGEPDFRFERTPIKYMLDDTCILRLIITVKD